VKASIQVVIPNFSRQQALLELLRNLRSQWQGQFEVLLIDDNSTENPEPAIHQNIPDSRNWIHIMRNPCRVGLGANITFCFLHCSTEWMWLLGNDDEIAEDAISIAAKTIGNFPDAAFINFASNLVSRRMTCCANGLDEFLHLIDSHANLNFISTGLYRVQLFKPYVATGFHYAYTFSPHLAMLFSLLRDHRHYTAVLSDEYLCSHRIAAEPSQRWSHVDFALGAAAMLELDGLSYPQRKRIAQLLVESAKVHEFLTLTLLRRACQERSPWSYRFILESIVQRYFYFDLSLIRWLKKKVYPLLFIFPCFSLTLLRLLFKALGKEEGFAKYNVAPRQGTWR
jgi:glycosyltransferase involved in cell wall biosynthesis